MFLLKNWLKPGGKLLITDYCCGPKPWSDEFIVYVEQRGYDLLTTDEYKNALVDAGFVNVTSEDKTEMFADYLNKELDTLNGIKEDFIQVYLIFFHGNFYFNK
jgi:phosphoethanolamine N-methyltransferase